MGVEPTARQVPEQVTTRDKSTSNVTSIVKKSIESYITEKRMLQTVGFCWCRNPSHGFAARFLVVVTM